MSDTPRTDERKASFALDTIRQLETELTAVTEQRDQWKDKYIQQNKDLGYELRDPNGTIWSECKRLQTELTAVTEQRDGLRSAVDYASDQLTAVTEQRDRLAVALEQWQPIETAPKDRSFILSAHPEHGYLITRWLGAREMWDGWAIEPTHWMSLPKLTTP